MTNQTDNVIPTSPETLRNQARAKLIGSTPKGQSKLLTFFSVHLELRQPSLDAILGTILEGSTKEKAVFFLINYCYIPGSDLKVFEEADKPQILKWPFGDEYMKLQNAINDLMGIDIAEEEASLKNDPLEGQS